mgnify:CR=1 FL=1
MRLLVGSRLLYGVYDNIISWEQMRHFAEFLKTFLFPFPVLSAVVSVYAQAIAGLLFIMGYKIKWAALLMVFNFAIAYALVHWGKPYDQSTGVLAMLFSAVLFLFTGAGKWSFDQEPLQSPVAVLHPEKSERNIYQ